MKRGRKYTRDTMRLLALISGGIDSPVATRKMMRKNQVDLIHFHNATQGSAAVKDKIIELAKILSKEKPLMLYMIPFANAQLEIIKHVDPKVRMIIYRRVMFIIAAEIARKNKLQGFVTGDNLAQVASQTLDNMHVINAASSLPVHRPLLGYDKMEIVKLAREIGTYETSIMPYNDCCTFMISKYPETHAKLEVIENMEKKIDMKNLVKTAVNGVEVL